MLGNEARDPVEQAGQMRGDAPFESCSGVPSRRRIKCEELVELGVAVDGQRAPP